MIKIAGLLTAMFVLAHALTPEERTIILNFHKDTRYAVDPPASNMMLMKYEKKLESLAESWVKRCIYQHPNPQQYPEFKGYGQNLAVSGGAAQDIKWLSRGWADEKKYYFYHNNSCASGKTCGHYTQVIYSFLSNATNLYF
ncbi:unnamed protein product [Hydatigera taeniaeformis]|uniref:SCP domain-containing protein n=1 Tax=Hydatigena taeniaeformis TaxID=6205 RepID=A0A0R3WJL6_HYDTA|nr:unnamed protein product [Hydatigera taeniaeformis]